MPKKEDTVHYTYLSGDYLGVSYEGRKNIFRFLLSQRKITREILHESSEPIPVLKDKPQKSIPVHKQIKNPKKKVPKISKKESLCKFQRKKFSFYVSITYTTKTNDD